MAPENKSPRGKLQLSLDAPLLTASLTLTVDPGGETWDIARVEALLKAQGLSWGHEAHAGIEEALRTLARVESGPATVVVLSGQAPTDPVADTLEWKSQPIPAELAAEAQVALASAPPPRVFDVQVTKEKVEEIQTKKAALPFLKPKEERVVKVVRREKRVEVGVDPKPEETGFARRNDVLAAIKPGKPGKDGRNLRGDPIAARKSERIRVLAGTGAVARGNEVRAEVDGFYRRGRNWIDVVPHRAQDLKVYASPDRGTCLLDFTAGTGKPPAADEVLAKAKEAGFAPEDLIGADAIAALLTRAIAESRPLARQALSRPRQGGFEIKVSADRLHATLSLRKATGESRSYSLTEVGKAISARGFRGMDTQRVRSDILAFHHGSEHDLVDYPLVEGTPGRPADHGSVQWTTELLAAERVREIEARLGADSSQGFPAAEVTAAAFVKAGQPVGRRTSPAPGRPGRDVFGVTIAAEPGKVADLRASVGIEVKGEAITAKADGVLEIVTKDGTVFARVREYHEEAITVSVAADRMQAAISIFAGAAGGLDAEIVRAALQARGVVNGVDEGVVAALVERALAGETVRDAIVARGREPVHQTGRRLTFRGSVVVGRSFVLAKGTGAQNLTVKEGQEIAGIEGPAVEAQDGFDVLGTVLPARKAGALDIKLGANVARAEGPAGGQLFVARKSGEVFYDGSLLDVKDTLVIEDSVGAAGGLVRFSGSVQIRGSVTAGARIFSGGDVHIAQMVEQAIVSSEGSISVGGGVKGAGTAILRAKNHISALYVEQATLLAVGDVRIKNSCLQCRVSCNSRMILDGDKAALVGGRLKARSGIKARHVGSEKRTLTEISFGQDYLVEDQIGVESREIEKLKAEVARLDFQLGAQKPVDPAARQKVEELSRAKVTCLKTLEKRTVRLFSLRERFETHFPSEIVIEGKLYPGVVFESHGRTLQVQTPQAHVSISFDQNKGQIQIRPLDGRG